MEVSNSQSIYFASIQSATQQQVQQNNKLNSEKTKKSTFASSLKKLKEEEFFISEGLPLEIANMSEEEALVFLKDELEIAGEKLKKNAGFNEISEYRNKISNFIKYISKNNFEVIKKKSGFNRRKKKFTELQYIQVIDQKVNQLTSDILYNQSANINILAKLEEINGLIIDLMAA